MGDHWVDDFELLGPSADAFVERFVERYGLCQVGTFESDPEQLEYEELLELGRSLRGLCVEA